MSGKLKRLGHKVGRGYAGHNVDPRGDGLPSGIGLVAIFLVTLVLAIVIPLVLNTLVSKKLSGIDQFLLGVSIYVALTLTTQAYHLRRLDAKSTKDHHLWRINSDFDRRLANIRESFEDITRNRRTDPEFYSLYFERSLEIFELTINEAASNCELLVDENHLSTTDMLLASFSGREQDVARFVHYFQDNDWMFDTWARNYCVRLWDLVKSRKLREVKRLFIVREPGEEGWEQSKKLMEFHGANEHYDYRILPEETYDHIVHDYHMREQFKDFGIYGDWYVYRTIAAAPERIEGMFSSSERKIRDYQHLFQKCWDHAPKPAQPAKKEMTPEELFGEPIVPVSAGLPPAVPPASVDHAVTNDGAALAMPNNRVKQSPTEARPMIDITSVSNGADQSAVRASLLDILDTTPLCTIATADSTGVPAASTAFYALDRDELVLHVLTGPDTVHGRNILASGRAALTVYSTEQHWTDAKRGVQLHATAGLTAPDHLEDALQRYLKAYPGLSKWVGKAADIEANLENRFFTFVIDGCKIFDEPNFGTEVWIEVTFATRSGDLIATPA